jgi:type IV pilus assembly protein PilM
MRAVGLDVGHRAFHLVVVDGTPKRWRVVALASETLPRPEPDEDPAAAVAAAVENAFRRLHAPRDPVVATASAAECVFRTITVPFVGREAIRKVLKFESEGHLHQWNIEDVVVDYLPVAETKSQTTLLVAAVPKAIVRRNLSLLSGAGIDPQCVELDATALFNAAKSTGVLSAEGTILLLHVGARSTLLLIVEGGILRHVRAIRSGLEHLTTAVGRDLGVDEETAAKKASAPEAPADEIVVLFEGPEGASDLEQSPEALEARFVSARRREFIGRLAREVGRSTAALALQRPLDAVYMTGGGAALPGFAAEVAERLGRSVEVLNLLRRAETDLPENEIEAAGAPVAAALGAALKGIGVDATGIDFRQEELRFKRRFDRVKVPLLCMLFLLFTGILLQFVYLWRQVKDGLRPSYEAHIAAAESLAKNIANVRLKVSTDVPRFQRIGNIRNEIQRKYEDLREKLGQGAGQPMSAFEAWRLLFEAVDATKGEMGRFVLDNLSFNLVERAGKDPYVQASFDATFLGDTLEASQHYEALMGALRSPARPWFRALEPPGTKPAPGEVAALEAKNVKLEIVVPQEPT